MQLNYSVDCNVYIQEADTKSGGTISLEEFLLIFDKLFALGGKVCIFSSSVITFG